MNTPVSLLERLQQPDQPEAWKRFVDLYMPLLFLWARRLGLQTPDAADLVQDVFAVLVQKLPEFRYDRQKSFQAWLHTMRLWDLHAASEVRCYPVGASGVAALAVSADGHYLAAGQGDGLILV